MNCLVVCAIAAVGFILGALAAAAFLRRDHRAPLIVSASIREAAEDLKAAEANADQDLAALKNEAIQKAKTAEDLLSKRIL
jgi:hypothetical protein